MNLKLIISSLSLVVFLGLSCFSKSDKRLMCYLMWSKGDVLLSDSTYCIKQIELYLSTPFLGKKYYSKNDQTCFSSQNLTIEGVGIQKLLSEGGKGSEVKVRAQNDSASGNNLVPLTFIYRFNPKDTTLHAMYFSQEWH
jgi:hypothetical protein